MQALQSVSDPSVWGNIRREHGKATVHSESWPNYPFTDNQTKQEIESYYDVDLSGFNLVPVRVN